ncbi:MAG: peptidase T [Bacteroidaceae bacterium]|nr:peptidase T [Bacteroidaceae bacterium]
MDIVERFLNYTRFDTQSSDSSTTTPSTEKQWDFVRYLKKELESEGLDDVYLDDLGYLYATLPANCDKKAPVVGFIAHYDTSPDCSGANICPRIVENYDGEDIVLDAEADIRISPSVFPELLNHKGEDIIVTNGHTLLGADDKAGIAEIVEAMVYLKNHPEIEHGDIRIAFNPDEEIGCGAHNFDVERFGCEWAYTIDGSEVGELEFENFNAASAKITVTGVSVHPGYAKNKMINAVGVATELASLLPANEKPEATDGYEGFFHLTSLSGNVENAELSYIIRDHDRKKFEARKKQLVCLCEQINEKYGRKVVKCDINDQYYNMREQIDPVMHVIDIAIKAMEKASVPVKIQAIRGGTDGAQLSFKGLPCPNIFAGGMNFHGPLEYLPIPSLHKAMQTIVQICNITAQYND